MKHFILLVGSVLIFNACSNSSSDIKNLKVYGSRFSKESLAERNLTQSALRLFAEEKLSLTNEEENKKAFLEKAIKTLERIETQAKGIHGFIYAKESELLKSAGVKGELKNAKGIIDFSKEDKNITFDFKNLVLKEQNSGDINLSELEKTISEFKVTIETNFKDEQSSFNEFIKEQNVCYSFNASEYQSSSSVLENLILLEEIEFGFNKYYRSIIEEYKMQSVRKSSGEFGFTKIQEVFIPEAKVVDPGQEFTAKVMYVSFNDESKKIEVTANQGKVLSVKNGIATIKYKAPKSGDFEMSGTIAIKSNSGVIYTRPFSDKVSVRKFASKN